MTDTLKPCPCCGGEMVKFADKYWRHNDINNSYCVLSGARIFTEGDIRRWNTRAPVPVPDEVRNFYLNSIKVAASEVPEARVVAEIEQEIWEIALHFYSGPTAAKGIRDD